MTKKEIDEMRQLAYNLRLVGWQRLHEDSEETIERVCNGIGPSWFPAVIRQAIDKLHLSLKVVAMIHDLDYYHGDGTYDDFIRANKAFGTNGVRVADAFVEVEKPKAFDCKDGNCSVIVGSRDVRHQQKVAKQLIDDGYVDKDEKPKEGELTVYQNLNDLQERCKVLRKFNVDETRCYIHHFVVKDGKLTEIEFRMIDFDGTEFVTTCVGCCTMPELAEVEE